MDLMAMLTKVLTKNGLIFAFVLIGLTNLLAYKMAGLTKGRIHGSAVAIFFGLVLAYIGGGAKGIATIPMFAGIGMMGGAMFRDFAIVSTAFGADLREIKKVGVVGVLSLVFGLVTSWIAGVAIAYMFGYRSPVDLCTIGAGVVKSVLVMIMTPFVAKAIGLNNPQSAMVFGGIMGTTSGTAAGMAAVDPKLVPYCAMTATFYTGSGCLTFPSIFYLLTKAIFG